MRLVPKNNLKNLVNIVNSNQILTKAPKIGDHTADAVTSKVNIIDMAVNLSKNSNNVNWVRKVENKLNSNNSADNVPTFKIQNESETKLQNSNKAIFSQYFDPKLDDKNANIFATFGYKDPRYYIPFNIKNEQILALIDSGSTKTYVGQKAAKLLGKFDSTAIFMKAANNKTV